MTQYPYAGGSWKFTGPSYKAMAILGGLTDFIVGALLLLASMTSTPAHAQGRTAWQVWMECVGRYHGGRLPDYCINAYRAVTGQ